MADWLEKMAAVQREHIVEKDSALCIHHIAYLYTSIIKSMHIHSLQLHLDRIFMKDLYIVLYSNENHITHGE
jgi:hypothetical protein